MVRFRARRINCPILLSYLKITARKVITCVIGVYVCPTEAVLKTKIGGTIKEPQWYGLGTPAPKSYHSVLFF